MRLFSLIQYALLILVLTGLPRPVHAFEPLNTDDAGTVGKNVNQIEQYFMFYTTTRRVILVAWLPW